MLPPCTAQMLRENEKKSENRPIFPETKRQRKSYRANFSYIDNMLDMAYIIDVRQDPEEALSQK